MKNKVLISITIIALFSATFGIFIPSGKIKSFEKQYATRKNISRPLIVNKGDKYLQAWELITNPSKT